MQLRGYSTTPRHVLNNLTYCKSFLPRLFWHSRCLLIYCLNPISFFLYFRTRLSARIGRFTLRAYLRWFATLGSPLVVTSETMKGKHGCSIYLIITYVNILLEIYGALAFLPEEHGNSISIFMPLSELSLIYIREVTNTLI